MSSMASAPISGGIAYPSRLFEALSHPAQAAAAAAHAGSQPPRRRGRKRKIASFVLSIMCIAVVKYSGSLYDYDDYYQTKNSSNSKESSTSNNRRARLRSKSQNMPEPVDARQILSSHWTASSKQQHQKRQERIRARIVQTIKAAFVADAASMGTHWIYELPKLHQALSSSSSSSLPHNNFPEPEFRTPPVPQYYSAIDYPGHYDSGQASPYGEQLLFVTQYAASLTQLREMNTNDDTTTTTTTNNNNKEHRPTTTTKRPKSILEPMSLAMQEWADTFGGRPDQATKDFLTCRRARRGEEEALEVAAAAAAADDDAGDDDTTIANHHQQQPRNEDVEEQEEEEDFPSCGADDDQAHFFLKIIPMTCMFVGHRHRRHYVEQAIRVHQNNEQAVMFGLALSDLLERVLLMDDTPPNQLAALTATPTTTILQPERAESDHENNDESFEPPVKSLKEALDKTLVSLQNRHSDGWFHFAVALTSHHQQMEALLEAWGRARDAAEHNTSMEQVASEFGQSCHMPGALIVSLEALYKATISEEQEKVKKASAAAALGKKAKAKKVSSTLTHAYKGYAYYVKALIGTQSLTSSNKKQSDADDQRSKENTFLVSAVRENILAAGDTCSRAILIAAVLGAAYGEPPAVWWEKVHPVLAAEVEDAAYKIADYASVRLK